MNNNSLFDIFDYLGIPVTDDPEVVRKAIDALKVGTEKYKKLYGNPKFSQIRSKIYTKNNSAFLAYVQEIRTLRQSNQQNDYQQNYNQQNDYQENDYQEEFLEYVDDDIPLDDDIQQALKQNNKNTFLGCAFLIFVCFCIIGGIRALFDSGSTTLSNPKVKFNDVDRQSVKISWEPVENADYYLLKNKSDDLPKTEIRNRTDYIVFRHDDRTTEYSLIACSDDEKYKPSSSVKINIESVKSHLQETENETEEEPEDKLEDDNSPSVLTPDASGNQKIYSSKHYKDSHYNKSPGKTVLDVPKPRIVETQNSVLVLWDVVENADRYLLEIKMGKDGKSFSKVVNDSMYTFTTLKPNKEYFITVTAIPKDESRFSPSPSKTISFTLQPK